MDPQKVPESAWISLISNDTTVELEFLALKIMLTRLRREVKINPDPGHVKKCAGEMKEMFVKCWNLPKVQNDFKNLVAKGGLV